MGLPELSFSPMGGLDTCKKAQSRTLEVDMGEKIAYPRLCKLRSKVLGVLLLSMGIVGLVLGNIVGGVVLAAVTANAMMLPYAMAGSKKRELKTVVMDQHLELPASKEGWAKPTWWEWEKAAMSVEGGYQRFCQAIKDLPNNGAVEECTVGLLRDLRSSTIDRVVALQELQVQVSRLRGGGSEGRTLLIKELEKRSEQHNAAIQDIATEVNKLADSAEELSAVALLSGGVSEALSSLNPETQSLYSLSQVRLYLDSLTEAYAELGKTPEITAD